MRRCRCPPISHMRTLPLQPGWVATDWRCAPPSSTSHADLIASGGLGDRQQGGDLDVVLARCRGTFGSGGVFEPLIREIDDAADTVEWLRKQSWFGGRFATVGGSYMGFTQWALLMDPPPELAAAVIAVAPHDFSRWMYFGGAFALKDCLAWTDQVAYQEQFGFFRTL